MSYSGHARNRGRASYNQNVRGNFSEGIQQGTSIDNSEGAAEVVSDEEGDMVSLVELDIRNGLLSKGSSIAMRPSLLSTKMKKVNPCQIDCALSPNSKGRREDVLHFSRLCTGIKNKN